MSLIKKFWQYINEEYELVTKIKNVAANKPKTKLKLPFQLDDGAILALADEKDDKDKFVELSVEANSLLLSYGKDKEYFHLNDYDDILALVEHAYKMWKDKVEEFNLSENDILIDELSKSF